MEALAKVLMALAAACYVGCAGHESGLADEVFPNVREGGIRQSRAHEVVLGYVALSAAAARAERRLVNSGTVIEV